MACAFNPSTWHFNDRGHLGLHIVRPGYPGYIVRKRVIEEDTQMHAHTLYSMVILRNDNIETLIN